MTPATFEASYIRLQRNGLLLQRARDAWKRLETCNLCPQQCSVNRLANERGICHTGAQAVVASHGPHFGEEAPLVGLGGSGTVFFSYCNLKCEFCQNYELSQLGEGRTVTPADLANIFLQLQGDGCHNINLVSPSHVVPQFLMALETAAEHGLRLPIVYNTGGYDCVETLKLLDGIVDIYMPDMKYSDAAVAWRYSRAKDYPDVNRAAVREMHRQVGDLVVDARGIAQRGLLIRHLVMPDGLAGTPEIAEFIAKEISANTYINLMAQYRPCYRAQQHHPLNKSITSQEYRSAIEAAWNAGLRRFDRLPPEWQVNGESDH